MGTTYYLENRPKKSLKYYRQAIKLNPNSASFHLNLGSSLYRLKKIPPALEEYRAALALDPNVLTDRSALGTVVQARGADAKFFFYMAKVFASLGRADEAVRYLRRAFEDGFNDTKTLDQDKDFQKISEFPAYIELRANPPKAISD
jgi:tetratricopeptide (TPR) repeat protein